MCAYVLSHFRPRGSSVHEDSPGQNTGVGFPPSSRGSSWSRIEPVSVMSTALAGRFFTTSATWEAPARSHWKSILFLSQVLWYLVITSWSPMESSDSLTIFILLGLWEVLKNYRKPWSNWKHSEVIWSSLKYLTFQRGPCGRSCEAPLPRSTFSEGQVVTISQPSMSAPSEITLVANSSLTEATPFPDDFFPMPDWERSITIYLDPMQENSRGSEATQEGELRLLLTLHHNPASPAIQSFCYFLLSTGVDPKITP